MLRFLLKAGALVAAAGLALNGIKVLEEKAKEGKKVDDNNKPDNMPEVPKAAADEAKAEPEAKAEEAEAKPAEKFEGETAPAAELEPKDETPEDK